MPVWDADELFERGIPIAVGLVIVGLIVLVIILGVHSDRKCHEMLDRAQNLQDTAAVYQAFCKSNDVVVIPQYNGR